MFNRLFRKKQKKNIWQVAVLQASVFNKHDEKNARNKK